MSRAGDAEQAHPRTHHGNISYTNPLLKPFEAQEAFEMSLKNVFGKGNLKKKKTEMIHKDIYVIMWSLPAGETCPAAGDCSIYCYAKTGRMSKDRATNAYRENLEMWKDGVLEPVLYGHLITESRIAKKDGKELWVRLHDSGDFFCEDYARMWFSIMDRLPEVNFYAYSKSVRILESVKAERGGFPANFHLVYSEGGKEDRLIPKGARRAIVIGEKEPTPSGYINGSHDDWYAMHDEYRLIALNAHGENAGKVKPIVPE